MSQASWGTGQGIVGIPVADLHFDRLRRERLPDAGVQTSNVDDEQVQIRSRARDAMHCQSGCADHGVGDTALSKDRDRLLE